MAQNVTMTGRTMLGFVIAPFGGVLTFFLLGLFSSGTTLSTDQVSWRLAYVLPVAYLAEACVAAPLHRELERRRNTSLLAYWFGRRCDRGGTVRSLWSGRGSATAPLARWIDSGNRLALRCWMGCDWNSIWCRVCDFVLVDDHSKDEKHFIEMISRLNVADESRLDVLSIPVCDDASYGLDSVRNSVRRVSTSNPA
jgi:hypothetical protein